MASPAASATPGGRFDACVWHARLAYHYQDAAPQGRHDAQLYLATETPVACAGRGAQTVFAQAGPATARGSARLRGSRPHAGAAGDPAGDRAPEHFDTYDKQLRWPAADPAADAAAGPGPASEPPAPSFVGAGFGTRIIAAGALAGDERVDVADPGQVPGDLAPARVPGGPYTAVNPPARLDRLQLELFFDPLPGTPSDPNGELAQVPRRTRAALAAVGGEAALAFSGHFFGAQTGSTGDGELSLCYRRTLRLAPAALAVDYCGWVTRGDESGTPEHVPPDGPAAP